MTAGGRRTRRPDQQLRQTGCEHLRRALHLSENHTGQYSLQEHRRTRENLPHRGGWTATQSPDHKLALRREKRLLFATYDYRQRGTRARRGNARSYDRPRLGGIGTAVASIMNELLKMHAENTKWRYNSIIEYTVFEDYTGHSRLKHCRGTQPSSHIDLCDPHDTEHV